jgi:hypothetical protein
MMKKAQQPPFGHVCGIPKRKSGVRRCDAPPPLHRGNQTQHFNRIVTQIEKTILDSAIASLKQSHHGKELGWDTKTSVDRKEPGQPTGERSTRARGLLREKSWHLHFESSRQNNQFNIRDTTQLRLNFRERCASQLQSRDRAASGEHFLRQSPLIGQWRWIYVWCLEKASEMEVAVATKGGSLRHFSARVGKTAIFSPAWNCGPTLVRGTFFGNRSSSETSKTRAMKSISQSGTRRLCDSRLATESRLMLQPRSWSLVAKAAWDQPLLARHFRTCGPMRFIAGFTLCDGNESAESGCVHTHTERACNSKDDVVKMNLMMTPMGFVPVQIASFWSGRRMWLTMQCHGNKRTNAREMCPIRRAKSVCCLWLNRCDKFSVRVRSTRISIFQARFGNITAAMIFSVRGVLPAKCFRETPNVSFVSNVCRGGAYRTARKDKQNTKDGLNFLIGKTLMGRCSELGNQTRIERHYLKR